MFWVATCANCGGNGDDQATFNLQISSNVLNKKCHHQESESDDWWFCSPDCLQVFLKTGTDNLCVKAFRQQKSLEAKVGDLTHEEYREAVACEHGEWPDFCAECKSDMYG